MREIVNIEIVCIVALMVYVWRVTPFCSWCWAYTAKIDSGARATILGKGLYWICYILGCEKCLSFQGGLWWSTYVSGFNITAITTACLCYLLINILIRWS